MPDIRAAEWILSLVTSRDRAASIAGDLLETATGAAAFWSSVIGTALTFVRRDLVTHAGSLSLVALIGAWQSVFGVLFSGIAAFTIVGAVLTALKLVGMRGVSHLPPAYIVESLLVGIVLLLAWDTGRWMAKESPGRELASGLVFILLQAATFFAVFFFFGALPAFKDATIGLIAAYNVTVVSAAITTRMRHPL